MAACKVAEHKASWFVQDRYCNYSAFNGYKRTPSDYSQVWCPKCPEVWRTKADYVDTLPDGSYETIKKEEGSEFRPPLHPTSSINQ